MQGYANAVYKSPCQEQKKMGKWEGDIITEHLSVLSAMPVRLAIRSLFVVALDGSTAARLEGNQCC